MQRTVYEVQQRHIQQKSLESLQDARMGARKAGEATDTIKGSRPVMILPMCVLPMRTWYVLADAEV